MSKRSDLETISEVSSSRERDESIRERTPQEELCRQSLSQNIGLEGILEVDMEHGRELWEVVHKNAMDNWSDENVSPVSLK